jgi:hypothetical protein
LRQSEKDSLGILARKVDGGTKYAKRLVRFPRRKNRIKGGIMRGIGQIQKNGTKRKKAKEKKGGRRRGRSNFAE